MDNDIAIKFDHVSKEYRLYKTDKQRFHAIFNKNIPCKLIKAVNDVSFAIKKGEAVALFGRNGAGKSTLLKMITRVTYQTSGNIDVQGRVSALLELTAGFDSEFSGRENIAFRGHLLGMTDEEIKDLEPLVEDFAELGDYMDQPIRTYSSGMKARLGFAINVNIDPEVLIVDEALSVGDMSFRKKCLDKVRELIEDKGVTFLFVTHSTGVAREFCTRGIVMKKGKLKFDGEVNDAADYYEQMVEREDALRKKKKAQKLLMAKKESPKKGVEPEVKKESGSGKKGDKSEKK